MNIWYEYISDYFPTLDRLWFNIQLEEIGPNEYAFITGTKGEDFTEYMVKKLDQRTKLEVSYKQV